MRQKIKIKVWSDLHLEFSRYNFDHIHLSNEDDKDTTLILSGDIGVGTSSIPFIEEMCCSKAWRKAAY